MQYPRRRLDGVSESATLKLNALVQSLQAQGQSIYNLTAGEPDFPVPAEIKKAVVEAVNQNQSKYTPVPGIQKLREAIASKTNSQQNAIRKNNPWRASNVVVTNGAKQSLFNAFLALVEPGEEVIIPSPYWISYPEMAKIAGGIPKFIQTKIQDRFKITPEQLLAALTPRSKVLILNSPSNPTGTVYSQKELKALGEVLLSSQYGKSVFVLSDEIYDQVIFSQTQFCSFLEAVPELQERTLTINGMSKSASMTGWRLGWTVAAEKTVSSLITLQGQSTSGVNALAQWAALAGLNLPTRFFLEQAQVYEKRRNLVLEILKKASRIEVFPPEGAFYFFVGIKQFLREGEDSIAFAERLLQEAQLAVVPGTPFGDPEFVRISFAVDEETLTKGCQKLVDYLR